MCPLLTRIRSSVTADLVTCRGGLVRPNPLLNFESSILIVMDIEMGHIYTSLHQFKPQNFVNMELHKWFKYPSLCFKLLP
jgi:hypothetical protein